MPYMCNTSNISGLEAKLNEIKNSISQIKYKTIKPTIHANGSFKWFNLGLTGTRYMVITAYPIENIYNNPHIVVPYYSSAGEWRGTIIRLNDWTMNDDGITDFIVGYIDLGSNIDLSNYTIG